MQLYQFATSHYCEKVRWVLDHKRLAYERVDVLSGSKLHREIQSRTGQTTLPVVRTRDDRWLRDSTVIALHVEAADPERPLLSSVPAEVTQIRLWEDWADEALARTLYPLYVDRVATDPSLRRRAYDVAFDGSPLGKAWPALQPVFVHRYRSRAGADPKRIPHLVERVRELMGWVDAHLDGRRYLVGDRFTLADLTVASMLAIVHRPAAADPHPVVGGPWRADTLPDDSLTRRVLAWQTRIYAEHRRS